MSVSHCVYGVCKFLLLYLSGAWQYLLDTAMRPLETDRKPHIPHENKQAT